MVFVYVLMALLGAAAMAFALQNPDPATVNFLNSKTASLPLSLLSLLSLLSAFVGVLFASVSGFARETGPKRTGMTARRPRCPSGL